MPELPEVETIKKGLQEYIIGHKIIKFEVKLKRIFSGYPNCLIQARIKNIRRFGKGLILDLNNNYSIAIHIKMTGQLIYRNKELGITNQGKDVIVPNKFTHIIFYLDKNAFLYYNDIRQFGWIKIVRTDKINQLAFFRDLGPEPFKGLTKTRFERIISNSRTNIKSLIMDQKKIGGLGNIYANDALYLARIDPRREANSLSKEEGKLLYDAMLTVLKKGLNEGGASEQTFVNLIGKKGNYQNHTLVYGKKGQNCKRCGTEIMRIVVGGRGTFFCPKCQKK